MHRTDTAAIQHPLENKNPRHKNHENQTNRHVNNSRFSSRFSERKRLLSVANEADR